MGRIFRNEGLGAKDNPEFTLIGSTAYADYRHLNAREE